MSNFRMVAVGAIVILADQLTKKVAAEQLPITLNSGISFGLFKSVPGLVWCFVLGLILVWLWVAWRSTWQASPVGSGMFFGGALSNVLDRVRLDGVHDWLPLPFTTLRNNLADWAVIIGLIIVFYSLFVRRTKAIVAAKAEEQHRED